MGKTNIPVQELWLKMGGGYAREGTYWWDSMVIHVTYYLGFKFT